MINCQKQLFDFPHDEAIEILEDEMRNDSRHSFDSMLPRWIVSKVFEDDSVREVSSLTANHCHSLDEKTGKEHGQETKGKIKRRKRMRKKGIADATKGETLIIYLQGMKNEAVSSSTLRFVSLSLSRSLFSIFFPPFANKWHRKLFEYRDRISPFPTTRNTKI